MSYSTIIMTPTGSREISNTTLTRDFLCAACFGALVEKTVHIQGQKRPIWAVICAKDPTHYGVISKASAAYLQKEAGVVMQALPPQGPPVLRSLSLEDDEGFD